MTETGTNLVKLAPIGMLVAGPVSAGAAAFEKGDSSADAKAIYEALRHLFTKFGRGGDAFERLEAGPENFQAFERAGGKGSWSLMFQAAMDTESLAMSRSGRSR